MTERAKEFYERDSVPTVTTAHTTLTATLATITQTGASDYTLIVETWRLSPWAQAWVNYRPFDGTLTTESRAEVARITRKLNGRMKL